MIRNTELYAPNNEAERKRFYNETVVRGCLGPEHPVILGGDFNCTLKDRYRRNCTATKEVGREEVQRLMHVFRLEDPYDKKYPDKTMYTYFKPHSTIASRIDYLLTCKTLAPFVQKVGCTMCFVRSLGHIFADNYNQY